MNAELAASSIAMMKPAFVALVSLVCLMAPISGQNAAQKPADKVEITLISDGLTHVYIDVVDAGKFKDAGKFTEKKIQLPPGSYVVAGRRVRYMDVNYPLEVKPGTPATLTVICTVSLDGPTSR